MTEMDSKKLWAWIAALVFMYGVILAVAAFVTSALYDRIITKTLFADHPYWAGFQSFALTVVLLAISLATVEAIWPKEGVTFHEEGCDYFD